MKLLVVDEDLELSATLCELLEESGYVVQFEADSERGLRRAQIEAYDLLILEGVELLQRIREQNQVPVLMLSAKGERDDRVSGLRAGADDYLAKPFYPDELLARVDAILRRSKAGRVAADPAALLEEIQIGELRLVPRSREVYFRGEPVELTAMEIEILEYLMRSFGKAVSRERLCLRLYNRLPAPFDRTIDTHVSRIRRKIGDGREMILSVRGTGYQIRSLPIS
ncbi:MAG: response regulator transcription factor [Bryobacteraceae bacterium]|jgi:two-component system, OmpR family, response regulator CpxR